MTWEDRLAREARRDRHADHDHVYHVSLRTAHPDEYAVGGLVAVTFRWATRPDGGLVFVTSLDPAAALRLGARWGLDEAGALAMVDSHERMHVHLQLAGVSWEREEEAVLRVDEAWWWTRSD